MLKKKFRARQVFWILLNDLQSVIILFVQHSIIIFTAPNVEMILVEDLDKRCGKLVEVIVQTPMFKYYFSQKIPSTPLESFADFEGDSDDNDEDAKQSEDDSDLNDAVTDNKFLRRKTAIVKKCMLF